jgi:predicted NAD/FAD-binding protein
MRIAIIGSGISGMTAAYYLRHRHEVTVFEAGHYIGGHTNTVEFEFGGASFAIDTGFIVFNDRTYPNFIALLNELNVVYQPTSMSFSVSCQSSGLEYRGANLNGLFAQRRNLLRPKFWSLISEMLRFNRSAERLLVSLGPDVSVGAFFEKHQFGQSFREKFFFPMASAIWSCPKATVEQFPMRFIVEFYRHHGLLSVTQRPQWNVIKGGSQQYMRKLAAASQANLKVHTPVETINRHNDRVILTTGNASEDSSVTRRVASPEKFEFDHVIFACHSDQALKILGASATPVEKEILGAFPYERNEAVLHWDEKVLPRNRRAWACWNYFWPSTDSGKATVTYNMNLLQGLKCKTTFCVSLNCIDRIDPGKIVETIEYHHPIFTTQRRQMQQRHSELLGPNRTSFAGAYWGNGFHEDGVMSALSVVKNLEQSKWKVASTRGGFDTDDTSKPKTAFASA